MFALTPLQPQRSSVRKLPKLAPQRARVELDSFGRIAMRIHELGS